MNTKQDRLRRLGEQYRAASKAIDATPEGRKLKELTFALLNKEVPADKVAAVSAEVQELMDVVSKMPETEIMVQATNAMLELKGCKPMRDE
jgi:hypothetical protein